jgi:hypothetical protein
MRLAVGKSKSENNRRATISGGEKCLRNWGEYNADKQNSRPCLQPYHPPPLHISRPLCLPGRPRDGTPGLRGLGPWGRQRHPLGVSGGVGWPRRDGHRDPLKALARHGPPAGAHMSGPGGALGDGGPHGLCAPAPAACEGPPPRPPVERVGAATRLGWGGQPGPGRAFGAPEEPPGAAAAPSRCRSWSSRSPLSP